MGVLAVVVVLAPWVGRNLVTFKDPTYISTGDGRALLGANCAQAYDGQGLGNWHIGCANAHPNADESVESRRTCTPPSSTPSTTPAGCRW